MGSGPQVTGGAHEHAKLSKDPRLQPAFTLLKQSLARVQTCFCDKHAKSLFKPVVGDAILQGIRQTFVKQKSEINPLMLNINPQLGTPLGT